ncbi:hypothetical protein ACHWQZ_G007285 [Mnemiopsis leidyi]
MAWRWLLVNQVLLLSYIALCDMTCNTDGVKCVATPNGCTADCDYLLKYKAASSDTTQVEISGKPSAHSLSSSTNLWLAYGFSSSGGMSGMTVYACQKYNEIYSAKKRATTGYGVSSTSTNMATSGVIGSLTDGVMTCRYTINNSELPSGNLKMAYGMGRMFSTDDMSKHSKTPSISSDSFSLIQQYSPSTGGCNKPTVPNGSVSPDTDTIESGSKYTVTCSSGYTISGVGDVTCTDGTLSSLPTCNPSPCNKPTIQDGTLTPSGSTIDSGSNYQVSCNSGFTISGSPTITCTNGQLSESPSCQPSEDGNEDDDKREEEDNADADTCALKSGCYSYPSDCSASTCTFSLRWNQTEAGLIEIHVKGKPADHSLSDTDKIWLAFGFSTYGTMADSRHYLCKKNGESYTAVRVDGYSHGLTRDSTVQINEGDITGSLVDGVMHCNFRVNSTYLPAEEKTLFHGMGPVMDSGLAMKHYKTPRTSTAKFTMYPAPLDSDCYQVSPLLSLLTALLFLQHLLQFR